jgi:hypothetical protein
MDISIRNVQCFMVERKCILASFVSSLTDRIPLTTGIWSIKGLKRYDDEERIGARHLIFSSERICSLDLSGPRLTGQRSSGTEESVRV